MDELRAAAGVTIREQQSMRGIVIASERARAVALADRTEIAADAVVLAVGAWSRTIEGLAPSLTAGGVLVLLEAAWHAVPAVEELPIAEMWVGHRPGSRDDAPILGPSAGPGLIYATGHHRNGILLAPVTANFIARAVMDGVVAPAIAPFGWIASRRHRQPSKGSRRVGPIRRPDPGERPAACALRETSCRLVARTQREHRRERHWGSAKRDGRSARNRDTQCDMKIGKVMRAMSAHFADGERRFHAMVSAHFV
jgi:hypothetical protein